MCMDSALHAELSRPQLKLSQRDHTNHHPLYLMKLHPNPRSGSGGSRTIPGGLAAQSEAGVGRGVAGCRRHFPRRNVNPLWQTRHLADYTGLPLVRTTAVKATQPGSLTTAIPPTPPTYRFARTTRGRRHWRGTSHPLAPEIATAEQVHERESRLLLDHLLWARTGMSPPLRPRAHDPAPLRGPAQPPVPRSNDKCRAAEAPPGMPIAYGCHARTGRISQHWTPRVP